MAFTFPRHRVAGCIAVLAWFALGLQFYLMVVGTIARQESMSVAAARFFLYFTVLTNLQAAITSSGAAFVRGWRRPGFEAATAVYIAMVGLGYSFLLRHLFSWTGPAKLADSLLHDVVPLLFVLWWCLGAGKDRLAWRSIPGFLCWPLIYFVATILMGAATHWYPYPFVNADRLGYPKVIGVATGLLLVTAVLGWAAVAWSRLRSKT